jgi:hypothetical protein
MGDSVAEWAVSRLETVDSVPTSRGHAMRARDPEQRVPITLRV